MGSSREAYYSYCEEEGGYSDKPSVTTSELTNLTGVKVWILQNPFIPTDIQVSWEEPHDEYDFVEPFEDYDFSNAEHTKIGLQKVYWKECTLTEIKQLG